MPTVNHTPPGSPPLPFHSPPSAVCRLPSAIFLILALVMTLSLGNKNGRASSQNKGNTGAPGDETSLGLPKTCKNCHNQGPIVASVAITVLDAANQPVTQYMPGAQYTASVKITASGTGLQGYGFQMIALRDAGNTDLDGFSDMNPNNYKIATISNGRTYAEHDNISSSNTFNVKWTAPAAGTGNITFYASGNGVNANGSTNGDGAGVTFLHLTEMSTVATNDPDETTFQVSVAPVPMTDNAWLNTGRLPSGDYRIKAFDQNGRVVWTTETRVTGERALIEVPATEWPAGVYFICLEGRRARTFVKTIKL